MSDTEQVKVVKDNRHKSRWGIERYLYRQDGKKLTIEKKWILISVASIFTLSSVFVLIRGPEPNGGRPPISFDGTVLGSAPLNVPEAKLQSERIKAAGHRTVQRYGGLEIVRRSNAGQIPPGTIVKARLVTGASNGLVKAQLIEELSVNGDVIAEVGSVLVGSGSSTEDRLMVDFTKLVFRDSSVQNTRAQACDQSDQSVGLKGSKVSKYGTALAVGIGLNFAGGMAQGLQETNVQGGIATKKNDLRNAALNGAANASLEQSKNILEKWKQQKEVIEVKRGTEICVIFIGE